MERRAVQVATKEQNKDNESEGRQERQVAQPSEYRCRASQANIDAIASVCLLTTACWRKGGYHCTHYECFVSASEPRLALAVDFGSEKSESRAGQARYRRARLGGFVVSCSAVRGARERGQTFAELQRLLGYL